MTLQVLNARNSLIHYIKKKKVNTKKVKLRVNSMEEAVDAAELRTNLQEYEDQMKQVTQLF